ncbi:hypothetical protein ACFL6U_13770 [Planctomycetota bacterium]
MNMEAFITGSSSFAGHTTVHVLGLVGNPSFAGHTTVHVVGLVAVAILGICVLLFPRRSAVIPFLVMACFVSSAQRIVIAGLDFGFLRIMVLFGVMRIFLYGEHRHLARRPLDKAVILWVISSIILHTLQVGTMSAFIFRLGFGFDAFGLYFVFRHLVRDWHDVDRIIHGCVWISIPIMLFFLLERSTGRNIFAVFGGVPAITVVREGRLRCQGAFAHAILAGCFWASLIPWVASLWWKSSRDKLFAIVGSGSMICIIFCCASSTPVLGLLCAIVGAWGFRWRKRMRSIRIGVVVTLIVLHIIMKAPVWHLVSRVSAVGGSTGWHRYYLINQTITFFSEWWLLGCSADAVASWGIHAADITNQYVLEGVRGGFLTLCLFCYVIVVAFREIGRLAAHLPTPSYRLILSWALGVSLFVHCTIFIGVSYFGQIWVVWYLLLAIIGSLSIPQSALKCIQRK